MVIARSWHVIDISTAPLGRLATKIATLLIGKNKPGYMPNLDTGDYVVVINSDSLVLTGRKLGSKKYYRHSGYPGGFREITAKDQVEKDSRKIVAHAVRGMLPKNKLQADRLARLKIFRGKEHPHVGHFTKI